MNLEYINLHYLLNCIACGLFVVARAWEPLCTVLFESDEDGECYFDWRDIEILMFLCFVLVVKNRRWKPLSNKEYISNFFLFGKCANGLLFMRHDRRWGVLYIIYCLILFVGFPEPAYKGPNKITYYRGQALDEELYHNPGKLRLVEFYAAWSPSCSRFSSIFAKLSMQYTNDYFEFGRLDVTKYPVIAAKFNVDSSVQSKSLPTLILFEDGKEKIRAPMLGRKYTASAFIFREENIISHFDLNEYFVKTKEKSKKHKKDAERKLK